MIIKESGVALSLMEAGKPDHTWNNNLDVLEIHNLFSSFMNMKGFVCIRLRYKDSSSDLFYRKNLMPSELYERIESAAKILIRKEEVYGESKEK